MLLELAKDMLPKDNALPYSTYEAKKSLSRMSLPYEKIHACPNDLPRFKRWFSKAEDAKKLTWNFDSRVDDGMLRHPADSPQWRFIDGKFPDFAQEKRNLRLALSTDGFNLFGSLSNTYSTWSVMLVTYNLPPSLCMKRRYMFLSLLIQGPKQPGNDIDVYLTLVINDLIMLWEEGVEVFDAYRNENFNLTAMPFCTIQDFPAYGNLSGYTVKGKTACPISMEDCMGTWLNVSKKHVYPNVCDSVIGTLLNIDGKTKDGKKARDDLKDMAIRGELHAIDNDIGRTYLPPAAFTLLRKEKIEFCESLARVKVPEGYSSNIRNLVNMETLKLVGLKSHDCHVLMQQLLPVAICSILPKDVRFAIIRLCGFFHAIYSKVIDPKELTTLKNEIIVLVLCQLEMYFPPSFFDVMVHLPVHLVREIRYCGPVHMRNQWCFERKMKTYKGFVKNAFHPEGCIAERLFYEEVLAHTGDFF
ncbi:uncharacterized protein LOC110717416 [Chenopodium quinoa]|uniref:uncharacterized protein LOC110717416 n=1 Tax=Chenopodium quinoa TaxID=63459 RepID=UPI000B76D9C4|nr:uncharacterized protein LOC110717416 [Chenopodium quinoa]